MPAVSGQDASQISSERCRTLRKFAYNLPSFCLVGPAGWEHSSAQGLRSPQQCFSVGFCFCEYCVGFSTINALAAFHGIAFCTSNSMFGSGVSLTRLLGPLQMFSYNNRMKLAFPFCVVSILCNQHAVRKPDYCILASPQHAKIIDTYS